MEQSKVMMNPVLVSKVRQSSVYRIYQPLIHLHFLIPSIIQQKVGGRLSLRKKKCLSLFEVITYLLLLREHNDPQLRGACANLLAKLIQTTVRLLTISPPITSLTNSFNNSFINQCSLVSIDSQESSRLGKKIQF